jgi:adenylate cyclase
MNTAISIFDNFVKPPALETLPERVTAEIARREWSNELLARTIQLLVILLFCFIYAISPKTSPQDAFTPVPYVLAVYLGLSVFGLVWGYLREPKDWSAYVSIIFDFALLYGLMVSFHIQYMQPASFILKAPTLLYVFIFIAIRALRFKPRFVLAAGAAAAIGWALVIVYVVRIDPGDNMLTRSYVEYLTSNSILIGAEVDKIMSILFVTAILALAVNGSGNLLVRAISEQSAANDLSRFFDTSVAQGIRNQRQELRAGTGEKFRVTIMMIDIRGFTTLAERLEASAILEVLSAYHRQMIPVVQSHGGVIDKFMGDGILAVFGVGEGAKSPAADALRACEEIFDDLAEWPKSEPVFEKIPPIRIGVGLASGMVSYGPVGGGERLEMTAIGKPVNLAAKLEKHNKKRKSLLICDDETWSRAVAEGYRGAFSAKAELARVEGLTRQVRIRVLR